MEFTHAGCKKKIPDHLFMCSELYIAAYDGQTDEVVRLLGESSGVAVESPTIRATPAAQAAGTSTMQVLSCSYCFYEFHTQISPWKSDIFREEYHER
jgi:hypothetical protein